MHNRVFSIEGNKIKSFIAGENSLMFSSQTFDTVEEFTNAWEKKLSLATKVEVKYDAIKSIKKDDDDNEVFINYKTFVGIPSNCVFSFKDAADYDVFYNFLEKERYFSKTYEKLTPFKAILNYFIGLVITIAITIFSYYEAIAIANGTAEEAHSGKSRMFNYIVELLGDKGVLAVGGAISFYIIYKIWTRFSNPPHQLKFLPPKI